MSHLVLSASITQYDSGTGVPSDVPFRTVSINKELDLCRLCEAVACEHLGIKETTYQSANRAIEECRLPGMATGGENGGKE